MLRRGGLTAGIAAVTLIALTGCSTQAEQAQATSIPTRLPTPSSAAFAAETPVAEEPTAEPVLVTIPSVVGLKANDARDELKDLGLDVDLDGGDRLVIRASNWTVDTQSIAPGESVPENTEIMLSVSKPTEADDPEEGEATIVSPSGFTIGMALVACKKAGKEEYPYGFDIPALSLQTKELVGDEWHLTGEAEVTNVFGAERSATVDCRATGTADSWRVTSFSLH